ncbi:MAG: hypothetical protein ACREHE_14210 [Rhizomicrobium sp.]
MFAMAARAQDLPAPARPTVAIICGIGHELTEMHIGTTAFTNDQHKVSIEDWKLDDFTIRQAGEILGNEFTIVSVPYNWHDFDTHGGGLFGDDGSAEVPGRVRAMAPANGPDYYVVISHTSDLEALFDTNQHFDGVGVVRRTIFGLHKAGVFAYFAITAVDGHTFENLGTRYAVAPNRDERRR